MSPRPLELFDLPKLPQFRNKIISLDCALILTRGNPLRAVNFLAHLNPTRRIYTAIHENGEKETLLGSIRQQEGESFARLTYLASDDDSSVDTLLLIEHLIEHARHWRAYQVVAEINEDSPLFQPLRQSGFSVYARQRVWAFGQSDPLEDSSSFWRRARTTDGVAIQSLQRQIVPPLLQQVESFDRHKRGVVCRSDELFAYIDVLYGGRGIFLRPLIHPNVDNVREKLQVLLVRDLVNRRGRPVYFCVRSYQAWIEPILEDMNAKAGPRQVVMVKHLVNIQRSEKTIPTGTDTAWANPAAPIHSSKINEKGTS